MSADSKPQHTVKDLTRDPDSVFEALWVAHGIEPIREIPQANAGVTPRYNQGKMLERLHADRAELEGRADELESAGLEEKAEALRTAPVYKGMATRAIVEAVTATDAQKVSEDILDEMRTRNVIDSNVAERSTPLVFDPDVRGILRDAAPLATDRWAREGQEGYEAVFNRIDQREAPLGRVPEAISRRLQDFARDFGLNLERVPMRIYADTAEIGDFAATASAHYMNLEDTTIGTRMSEYALFDEQEMLYGRYELDSVDTDPDDLGGGSASDAEFDYANGGGPETPLEGGSPVGDYATRGIAEWCRLADEAASTVAELPDTDHHKTKDTVTEDFLYDIKREIREMLQGPYATNPGDLEVWASWTMYNELEDGLIPRARHDENQIELDFGNYDIQVGGITVYPSHNIDQHTYVAQDEDGDENDQWDFYDAGDDGFEDRNVGDEGDVFIVNTATWRKRELSPLSSFPLAVRGAADEVAMVAYDGNVELSGGFFAKALREYAI